MRRLKRLYHFLYASFRGYFWLPCKLCGHHFGGHEKNTGIVMTGPGGGYTVCPACAPRADQMNAENPGLWRITRVVASADEAKEV